MAGDLSFSSQGSPCVVWVSSWHSSWRWPKRGRASDGSSNLVEPNLRRNIPSVLSHPVGHTNQSWGYVGGEDWKSHKGVSTRKWRFLVALLAAVYHPCLSILLSQHRMPFIHLVCLPQFYSSLKTDSNLIFFCKERILILMTLTIIDTLTTLYCKYLFSSYL